MAQRVLWDEAEAILLFDAYDKIQKNTSLRSELIAALSKNLRRRARDNGINIDNTFRNIAGVTMRLSEIEKILNPSVSGLAKTSELFRKTAILYHDHRRTFLKQVQEYEEYRIKILGDLVAFDLLEAVVLLDAYLTLEKGSSSKAYTARLVSAKLRALASNRGCVFNDGFRSDTGILGRLRKMQEAFCSELGSADVPESFHDAVRLYHFNRAEYRKHLKKANSLIGKIILAEDVQRKEKEKQRQRESEPVKKTTYVRTKKDRKLKETDSKAFVAVYQALEHRCHTDPCGVTGTVIYNDLNKKYPRKTIIEILSGASWSKEIRTGKYVHALGASYMSLQESNEKKYLTWLKKKLPAAQFTLIENNKSAIVMLLMQRRIYKMPLFLIEDANEVGRGAGKVPSCFSNVKLRSAAVQLVTMYATYLEELATQNCDKVDNTGTSDNNVIDEILRDAVFEPLRAELKRQNICTLDKLKQLDLWRFMNRYNVYTIGARHVVCDKVHTLLGADEPSHGSNLYTLHVDNEDYSGATPSEAFLQFCENMASLFPLKYRSLIGVRVPEVGKIAVRKNGVEGPYLRMRNLEGYVFANLSAETVMQFASWMCQKCGKAVGTINLEEHHSSSAANGNNPVPIEQEKEPVEEVLPVEPKRTSADEAIIRRAEEITLKADMDGISYENLRDSLQMTMVQTKQVVASSARIVDVKGKLIHEDAFIDWEDGADAVDAILEKLLKKNNGYVSIGQLYDFARADMNMFLNDNDLTDERSVYDIAQHLFEKAHYRGKTYSFAGKMHISDSDTKIGSNLDIIKKYAADQGGVFKYTGLVEYLESIGISTGNLRMQMRLTSEPIFFYYNEDTLVYSEFMNMDDSWEKTIKDALRALFDDVGDHIILRQIPQIWLDRLPPLPGALPWTPLLLQSILRFYKEEFGASTIQAMDGQAIDTLHTLLVENGSPIQNFGDVVISYLVENNIGQRAFKAEALRSILVDAEMLRGNQLIWNMPKALKGDYRFAWDAKGDNVTVMI